MNKRGMTRPSRYFVAVTAAALCLGAPIAHSSPVPTIDCRDTAPPEGGVGAGVGGAGAGGGAGFGAGGGGSASGSAMGSSGSSSGSDAG
ncbi:hypothetical protein, partial [Nocardia tengchongensis]|uniref:hypothetical protein n=1 Tax=Nocardia tengchongensis TaxID=2055889 RepID=UPI0036BE3B9A